MLALFLSPAIGLTLDLGLDAAADATGEAHGIDVTLTEFAIGPDELAARSGMPVSSTVTNAGAAEHDFTIDGVAGTETLAAMTPRRWHACTTRVSQPSPWTPRAGATSRWNPRC